MKTKISTSCISQTESTQAKVAATFSVPCGRIIIIIADGRVALVCTVTRTEAGLLRLWRWRHNTLDGRVSWPF